MQERQHHRHSPPRGRAPEQALTSQSIKISALLQVRKTPRSANGRCKQEVTTRSLIEVRRCRTPPDLSPRRESRQQQRLEVSQSATPRHRSLHSRRAISHLDSPSQAQQRTTSPSCSRAHRRTRSQRDRRPPLPRSELVATRAARPLPSPTAFSTLVRTTRRRLMVSSALSLHSAQKMTQHPQVAAWAATAIAKAQAISRKCTARMVSKTSLSGTLH